MEREHVRSTEGPSSGHRDGLQADGEEALPHSEEWAHFLRNCCAGCHAAAGRVREREQI